MHPLVTAVPPVLGLVGVLVLGGHVVVMGVRGLGTAPRRRAPGPAREALALTDGGDHLGPVLLLPPVALGHVPEDTRGLPFWEHPRTGARVDCPRCGDGWVWLWYLPEIPVSPTVRGVVMAECRCGVIWREGDLWRDVPAWYAELAEARRPRIHAGTERAHHLARLVRDAVRAGAVPPPWWVWWALAWDGHSRIYTCPRCHRPAPDVLTGGEPRTCAGCGRDLGAPRPRRGLGRVLARLRGR
ncbi:hypothetical protein SAMN05421803_1515 [Nocardiopsis flavescens]|uniref:Uncharacterized protein n=1 Tax=Nocardiopsis flavescens TaxID=758803 RepID=A0A1M6WUB4_9ACTN|nr:hypothetical protein SAMN05421803_1515 [Nocardiopsis flavescens]